ncbi:unnamed protein product [Pleuronectes platessa]|uniref:Uncharacterized protein n=1 Tax=Pleuronectes platessa TaxID=8262 RepID=A0A9N7YD38_PLEPL|nr:unnamed protein product [Pleuronectes platessa]
MPVSGFRNHETTLIATHNAVTGQQSLYTGRHHLMAFGVSTESKASWEPYVIFLASAPLPALLLSTPQTMTNFQEHLSKSWHLCSMQRSQQVLSSVSNTL